MKYTDKQINAMAAEVLGIHECADYKRSVIKPSWMSCDADHWECSKCDEGIFCDECYTPKGTPDFCTDLNAAQRLLKKADAESTIMEPMLDALVLIELGEFGHRSFPTSYDVATASSKRSPSQPLLLPRKFQ